MNQFQKVPPHHRRVDAYLPPEVHARFREVASGESQSATAARLIELGLVASSREDFAALAHQTDERMAALAADIAALSDQLEVDRRESAEHHASVLAALGKLPERSDIAAALANHLRDIEGGLNQLYQGLRGGGK